MDGKDRPNIVDAMNGASCLEIAVQIIGKGEVIFFILFCKQNWMRPRVRLGFRLSFNSLMRS